jgi:phosphatidylinositol glycan class B
LNSIGITNPFNYALILRIITALLSWFLVCKFCLLVIKDFSSDIGKKIFLLLCFFLWFMPFISVRFSSENYSAITFWGALYFIIKYIDDISGRKIFSLAVAGLFLGFSLFFRFQMAFAMFGLVLWLIFVKKTNWKNLFLLLISGIFAIAFCIYLDFVLYGHFELTPVNYYISNIIQHKAAGWGIKPWWYYFYFFIVQAIPPISVILLVFFLIGLYKKPTNIFVWCIVPFLIAHFTVDHKEMRFLFPMVFAFMYLTAIGIDHFIVSGKYKKIGRFIFWLCLVINIPILIFRSIIPAQEVMSYYKYMYNYAPGKEKKLLCNAEGFYHIIGLNVNFYKSPDVKCIILKNDSAIASYLNNNKPDSIFVYYDKLADDKKYDGYTNERIYCLFPKWILACNVNNWQSRSSIWDIRKLKRIKK